MKKAAVLSILVAVVSLALEVTGEGQQAKKVYRIGYLTGGGASPTATSPNNEAFRQGLRELGYIESKNIIIEYRRAEGKLNRMPELAAELVSLGVDIIVTAGMPAVLAAKQATSTIPIVTASADNLVEAGVVASLARPGGNVTGSTRVDADFSAKRAWPGRHRVLLRFDSKLDASAMVKAAEACRMPLRICDIADTEVATIYDNTWFCRPDGHVAWTRRELRRRWRLDHRSRSRHSVQ